MVFLVCNATWCLEFLKIRRNFDVGFGIMELRLNRSFPGIVFKRAEMPFKKSNGKCHLDTCKA